MDYYNNKSNDGNIIVCLKNNSDNPFIVNIGDRICQVMFQKYLITDDDDADGERIGGVGSTGR